MCPLFGSVQCIEVSVNRDSTVNQKLKLQFTGIGLIDDENCIGQLLK